MRTILVCKLCLHLLIFFSILSFFIYDFLISNWPHFFWIAVFYIKSILTFEKYISCKIFCHLALILFFKINKSLLSSINNVYSIYFSLTSSWKIDLKFFSSSSNRKIFDKKTKKHDGFFVFEIVDLKLIYSLSFLFSFSNI